MKFVIFTIFALLFVVACQPVEEQQAQEQVAEEPFKGCEMPDGLSCNDVRIYPSRIELYLRNDFGNDISSVYIATDACSPINNPKMFKGQLVRYVLTNCTDTKNKTHTIYIDYINDEGIRETFEGRIG